MRICTELLLTKDGLLLKTPTELSGKVNISTKKRLSQKGEPLTTDAWNRKDSLKVASYSADDFVSKDIAFGFKISGNKNEMIIRFQ